MPLSISIGDAILLSRIAWGIGQAFTSGRKSAPAEFAEVQNLLFTLSEALKVLAKDLPDRNQVAQAERAVEGQDEETQADNALLAQMMMNCQSTLTHLKSMVDKYMELDKKNGQQGERKWKDEVKKNWKKLLWTREGGDIIKLKTTLTSHINGLNLALSAINKRYGHEIKGHVENMHTKLDDIHEWFKQNLEGRQATSVPRPPQHQPGTEEQNHDRFYFAVSVHTREYRKLHCPRATFQNDWLDEDDPFRIGSSIFQCCCSRSSMAMGHADTLHVSLLPSSMLVQVATQDSEPPRWHMYAAWRSTPHRSSSIYISEVESSNLPYLEAAASRLALVQARKHLLRNQSTSLVSFNATADSSPDDLSARIVSVLASKTEQVPGDDEGTCTLSFRVGESQFSAAADATYSILHYKSLPHSVLREVPGDTLVRGLEGLSIRGVALASAMDFAVHQPHVEVLFQEVKKGLSGGDNTYSIVVRHDTMVSQSGGPRIIRINSVLVVSEQKADSSNITTIQQIKCDAVDVEFGDSNDAQTLLASLRAMQSHLFHLYLTRPLFGEHILFHRFAGDTVVHDRSLPSATISLVYCPETDTYRVILVADTRAVNVCMPLSPRQLEALITDQNAGNKQFPAYFLVRDMDGTEVVDGSVSLDELVPGRTGAGLHPLLSMERIEGQGDEEDN